MVFRAVMGRRRSKVAAPPATAASPSAERRLDDDWPSPTAASPESMRDAPEPSASPPSAAGGKSPKAPRHPRPTRPDGAEPLPADMPVPSLDSIPKGPAGKSGKKSSSKQYGGTFNKFWLLFCAYAGWDPEAKMQLVDAEGNIALGTFRWFFSYLFDSKVGYETYKTCRAAFQCELERQLSSHPLRPEPPGGTEKFIARMREVKNWSSRLENNTRLERIELKGDLQAHFGGDVGPEKMIEIAWACLMGLVCKCRLMNYQTLMEVRYGFAALMRHDDMVSLTLPMLFTKFIACVGVHGMDGSYMVSDGGKTNPSGNYKYSAFFDHKNPLLCSKFATMFSFLERFLIMHEPFPDFLDGGESFYHRPVFRKETDHTKTQTYTSSAKHQTAMQAEVGVICAKLTHQGRGEGQRIMDDAGVSFDDIGRMPHYFHTPQCQSYLLDVPKDPMLAAAGHDHTMPRAATAAHLEVPVADSLIDALFPQVGEQLEKVEAEMRRLSALGAAGRVEAEKKIYYGAQGCLRYMKSGLKGFIRCVAARPRTVSPAFPALTHSTHVP